MCKSCNEVVEVYAEQIAKGLIEDYDFWNTAKESVENWKHARQVLKQIYKETDRILEQYFKI